MKDFALFAAAAALLVTISANAQTISVKANVPFNFIVNRETLPAGGYVVESLDDQGFILGIRGLNSKTRKLVVSHSCGSLKPVTQTRLIFHRYGDGYFLRRIWVKGNMTGHELPVSPREEEVAKDFSIREVVLVAAH